MKHPLPGSLHPTQLDEKLQCLRSPRTLCSVTSRELFLGECVPKCILLFIARDFSVLEKKLNYEVPAGMCADALKKKSKVQANFGGENET